ncbi:hypothetical protein HK105_202385 [Polyrhizophydium stewartii]|uniref:Uncharacterized protein n=1 Tax=Polyrhizophydium stewartii TaxID=2732419 RepID=A0ABR4NET8_9FUNG
MDVDADAAAHAPAAAALLKLAATAAALAGPSGGHNGHDGNGGPGQHTQPADAAAAISANCALLDDLRRLADDMRPTLLADPPSLAAVFDTLLAVLTASKRSTRRGNSPRPASLAKDIQRLNQTAAAIIEIVASCMASATTADPQLAPGISSALAGILRVCGYCVAERDFNLLNHAWKAAAQLLLVHRTHPQIQDWCLRVVTQMHADVAVAVRQPHLATDMIPDSAKATFCTLAKFFLTHLISLIKQFQRLLIQPQFVSLAADIIVNIGCFVSQDGLFGRPEADSTLFATVHSAVAVLLHALDLPAQLGVLVALADAGTQQPVERTNAIRAFALASGMRHVHAGTLRQAQPANASVLGLVSKLFAVLDDADPTFLVLVASDKASLYSEIVVSLGMVAHSVDPASWPLLERELWLPAAFEGYRTTLLPTLMSRLAPGSPLFARLRGLRMRISASPLPFDTSLLLPASLAVNRMTNEDLVAHLRRWETAVLDASALSAAPQTMDADLAAFLGILVKLWLHLCNQLDTEDDPSRAVEHFQRLHIIATPLARIASAPLDAHRRRFPLAVAAVAALRDPVVDPLVLYIEGTSGALEHAQAMADPSTSIMLSARAASALTQLATAIAACLSQQQVERILTAMAEWCQIMPQQHLPVCYMLDFIGAVASRSFADLSTVSVIFETLLQSTDWMAAHLASETAVAFASVSPNGILLAGGTVLSSILLQPLATAPTRSSSSSSSSESSQASSSLAASLAAVRAHLMGDRRPARFSEHDRAAMREIHNLLGAALSSGPY